MDRRWPWKKKSSDKATVAAAVAADAAAATLASVASQGNQDTYKKPKYDQISAESYSHLTDLEIRVKTYEEQVQTLDDEIKDLNEKLSAANSEISDKEDLVKQHSKVAEEAVSGWEKAEAEALALKNHLESVTLAKLNAEDKASHLDGALKECMRQIRNLKEEHEQKLQDVVISKNKQCEKIKFELEAKIANLEQQLIKADAENAAISRSLQERSNMLIKISEEKSQAEAEIELLKGNVECCEREINSMKYELHVASKELEIRNEEKNMSVRSAEVANKQHIEGAKKIAKLEAECQRLRGLVRKKLPGPAALAQMKLEVDSLGRDYGDTRLKRSPVRSTSFHLSTVTDFSLDNTQKVLKENEILAERLLAAEEETKMLKEVLAKRNSDALVSRDVAITNQQRSPSKVYSIQNASNPPSWNSLSEEGNEDDRSCAGSWGTALTSELSPFKKENNTEKSNRMENAKQLDLMDDFLEMEKLACSSSDSTKKAPSPSVDHVSPVNFTEECSESDADQLPLTKLRTKLSAVLESMSKDADMQKILEDIKHAMQDAQENLSQNSVNPQDIEVATSPGDKVTSEPVQMISQELAAAISQIHDFVMFLGREARAVDDISSDGNELSNKIEEFSITYNKVSCSIVSLNDFIFYLSMVLAKASELRFNVLGYKGNEVEINSPHCIDKVALPENMVTRRGACVHISSPNSDHEVPDNGYETKQSSKCCSEEVASNLASSSENLEMTKSQLHETEQLLAEAKSQLASAKKSNSLAETQLKCMAESYKSLETRADELETEVNFLRVKIETLENELQDEKRDRDDALARCRELQEQLQRNENCSVCSSAADTDLKNKQEKELAAAEEKLAECQETILLLGKQLKTFRPQTDVMGSQSKEWNRNGEGLGEVEPITIGVMLQDDKRDIDNAASGNGGAKPYITREPYNTPPCGASDTEEANLSRAGTDSKNSKHRPTKSFSSMSSSTTTMEKQTRGFSRFFSYKGKNGH